MVAPAIAVPVARRKPRRLLFRLVLSFLALILVAAIGGFAWFYRTTHVSLPQLDGSLAVPGLQAPVKVDRDAHGVPHISAASLEDLFFAQGYVTAQDRLWQMDMTRRRFAGELAEVLPGPSADWIKFDKEQRILRFRSVAERVAQGLPARDRAFLEAYARGVNAYIRQHRENLPFEFHFLQYSPRPWTVADSVLAGVGMSQLLNTQYETEYRREKIAARLSPELAADLYPASSWHDRPPASQANQGAAVLSVPQEPAENGGQPEERAIPASGPLRFPAHPASRDCESCLPGSNNWVVSGAHTVTGKPLLSNDMHLGHNLPGVWYEVHLHSGDYNVVGFSLPGLPYVIVGHNQRIAWGFTNLNPDVQDLFVENFNAAGEYQTPAGWQKPEIYHEVIHVRKGPDAAFDVAVTRHGPIVSSLFPGETRQIALQWIIYDTAHLGIPLFDVDSAQNWEQFRQAMANFATPSQNVVYGDVDGHIGYQPMGRVPIRASGDGSMPVSGADGKHDWTGYLPFDQLPSLYDPPSGVIATANARITPDGYPHLLATQWYPPYRAERIYRVLESGARFSASDMLKLQTDITSEYDHFFADRFVYAIDHSSKATSRARQAADILRGFDGRMAADSAAPAIEVNARKALSKKLLQSKLGDAWEDYEWSEAPVALENIVQNQPARWLPSGYANFNDLLASSVEEALQAAPAGLNSWKYGSQFPVEINHPLFGLVPVLKRWSGPGVLPQSGGSFTVKQVGRHFGPSERMTVDFSDLDSSNFNIVIGESGQLFSPYYMDQWDAWYNNKTFSMPYSGQAVQSARSHALTLQPGK